MLRSITAVTALAFALAACAQVDEAPIAETAAPDANAEQTPAFTGTAVAIDTTASTITWQAAKVTRTHDGGFHQFGGTLYLVGETLTGADVQIDPGSIYSDSERLTGHLKSEDFFDVAAFPEASFRATTFTPVAPTDSLGGDPTHRVTGTLTMHGQSREVTFPARIATTPEAIEADAEFLINRQDWGLSYTGAPDDLIRDEVRITLHVVAPRASAAGAPEA